MHTSDCRIEPRTSRRNHRRLIASMVGVFLLAAAVSAALFLFRSAQPAEPGDTPGVSVLAETEPGSVSAATTLTLDAVHASSFETTIDLSLGIDQVLGRDDSLVVPVEDVVVTPSIEPFTVGVRMVNNRLASLRIAGALLPPGTSSISVSVGRYVIIPGDGAARKVAGPWVADGAVSLKAVPPATTVFAGGRQVNTGNGFSYLLDGVRRDGQTVEVVFHVQGAGEDWRSVGGSPVLRLADGTMVESNRGVTPFTPERTVLRFQTSASLKGARIVFPAVLRAVNSPATLPIRRGANGWTGNVVVGGESLTATATEKDGFISVLLIGPDGGRVAVGSASATAVLRDDLGNTYELYHGSARYPDSSPDLRHVVAGLDFQGTLPAAATTLQLGVSGYAEIVRGDWSLPVE